jgi:thioredoxin 1
MKTPSKSTAFLALTILLASELTFNSNTNKPSQRACCLGLLQSASAADAPVASSEAAKSTIPLIVDLGAGKCIPCKMMTPILEELKKEYAGLMEVKFIDVWTNPDAGKKYGVHIIPTQIFYDAAGKELFRHEGFIAKDDILAKWKELGVTFTMKQ